MLCCDPSLKDIKWEWNPTGESPAQTCSLHSLTVFSLCLPLSLFLPSLLVSSKRHLEFHVICRLWPIIMGLAIQKHLIWLAHPAERWMSEGSHKTTWLQPFHWCDKWILYMKVRAANIFAYSKVLASGTTIFFISIATASIFNRKLKTNFKTHF